jgi:hypothetical protein
MFSKFISVQKKRPKKSGHYFVLFRYQNGPLRRYVAEYDAKSHKWYNTIADVDIKYWMKNSPKLPER